VFLQLIVNGTAFAKNWTMKTSFLTAAFFSLALTLGGTSSGWADSTLQNGTPGAQGTEGTNPTHQDQNVTGPNGEHASNSNPSTDPSPAHKSCSCSTTNSNSR
jgi:hypothetical protein